MPNIKMKKAVKDRWVAALRSGKYRQGRGYLCTTYKGRHNFCCLGVLAHEELDAEWGAPVDDAAWGLIYKGDIESLVLTPKARRDLGLGRKHQARLIEMNDLGVPFSEIAEWIKRNL